MKFLQIVGIKTKQLESNFKLKNRTSKFLVFYTYVEDEDHKLQCLEWTLPLLLMNKAS